MAEATKVGIIACSGEEVPAGTISRLATRRVLEVLRPESTVTLCLPLFLAGEQMERRFARQHPTITVDGCDKVCAKRATETYSGQVASSLVVTEILGDRVTRCHRSTRDADKADEEAVWLVAERIAAEVDALTAPVAHHLANETAAASAACCSCGTRPPEATLEINGRSVTVSALPLIFQHLEKKGLQPSDRCQEALLETVRIYHFIDPADEPAYRDALMAAYQSYCSRRSKAISGVRGGLSQ